MPEHSPPSPATSSVSAGIAAANAHLPNPADPVPRFPGEDGGQSLAEIAGADLDAALQLLAERAEYITGASGAAIALRHTESHHMLCRASAGSNAPELGALLSTEHGLSGESVRTHQLMRCDDAERDPRVNREVCRQLGIASVVVMPIISDEQVLGVFELFSGNPRAFTDRDLAALSRLGQMVEVAVKHAVVMQTTPALQPNAQPAAIEPLPSVPIPPEPVEADLLTDSAMAAETVLPAPDAPEEEILLQEPALQQPEPQQPPPQELKPQELEPLELVRPESEKPAPEPAPATPLFWSAPAQPQGSSAPAEQESKAVPPGLRNLQKCKACGFPVSPGRTFCVECDEKQWRGQPLPQPPAAPQTVAPAKAAPTPAVAVSPAAPPSTTSPAQETTKKETAKIVPAAAVPHSHVVDNRAGAPASEASVIEASATGGPAMFLTSVAPSESWLASNKYILGALLIVAVVIGAVAWLR